MVIFPWYKSSTRNPILTRSQVPNRINDLSHYLANLKLPTQKSGFKSWASIYLGSNLPFQEKVVKNQCSNMNYWCENTESALYP